ncbi:hypothetical protein E5S67_03275 [Microcoleus sp. IPMA8]|uniref:Uncharacterized protein n=1 Tax=Microcoleus asticus IPMA8 TaxID=2563858 RepID=A0ABX2D1J6_9CYAN|nr:hypothetical protein [Microcoleus asticus IPMA8]
MTPHSLGKQIEWKRSVSSSSDPENKFFTPHSLGKQIEWKRNLPSLHQLKKTHLPTRWGNKLNGNPALPFLKKRRLSPHSLGKQIEWKPSLLYSLLYGRHDYTPHSLGKQIEWKPSLLFELEGTYMFSPLAGETN